MLRPYERSLQPVHERSHAHDKGVVGARSVQRPAYLDLESRAKSKETEERGKAAASLEC
jgi:hypothetical protein